MRYGRPPSAAKGSFAAQESQAGHQLLESLDATPSPTFLPALCRFKSSCLSAPGQNPEGRFRR